MMASAIPPSSSGSSSSLAPHDGQFPGKCWACPHSGQIHLFEPPLPSIKSSMVVIMSPQYLVESLLARTLFFSGRPRIVRVELLDCLQQESCTGRRGEHGQE